MDRRVTVRLAPLPIAAQPLGDDRMKLTIISVDGTNTFTGTLKRGC